jgi:hypothetical protein
MMTIRVRQPKTCSRERDAWHPSDNATRLNDERGRRNMKTVIWSVAAVAILIALGRMGCRMSSPRYFIYMVNRTPREFEGVGVYFAGKMAAEKGHMVKGGLASYGYVTLPIPAEAEVRWDDRGVHHAPMIKLQGVVPDHPVGLDLYFIIEEDGSVTVKCVRFDDVDGKVEATNGIQKFRGK